jgi:hypothetical protein
VFRECGWCIDVDGPRSKLFKHATELLGCGVVGMCVCMLTTTCMFGVPVGFRIVALVAASVARELHVIEFTD